MKKPYHITYYNGIPKSFCCEERYKEAIDCGFDVLTAESQDLKITQDMLRYCETMGVRVNVYDSRITDIVYNNWETRLDDPETLEATIKEICEDYRDYPALYCYSIIDEPSSDKFPLLGKMVELFRKYDPAHFCYINLFPEGCTEEQLGNATYDAHLQAFADTVKPALMSNDRYHLLADNRPEENITITDEATAKAYAARLGEAVKPTLDTVHNPRWEGKKSICTPEVMDRIYIRDHWHETELEWVKLFGTNVSKETGYAASDHYGVVAEVTFKM